MILARLLMNSLSYSSLVIITHHGASAVFSMLLCLELLSGPCDSSGLLDWGFLGSFLAHLLTSSCGFRFRDPTRRGICPVLLKLILSLFRTYSAYACLLTAHCSWVSHDPCTPTYEQSFLLIITHHYSSWSICSLLYASLLDFMLKRCRRISITMCHNIVTLKIWKILNFCSSYLFFSQSGRFWKDWKETVETHLGRLMINLINLH